ncbi:uncharacterized protein LOC123291663 [Chrysoperla carnea]|uniref:uncharacterized protein LOC123291663 n=1 Tax=Chrysoperla carnea TaxID=189513 RepID=UPI001D05C84F|nr:uncharacterized protein LOC123291663 [Chrysoperla carnea]XP_044727962.1 uncharacterized protein LOC123291663 [Chrysoperla carnea]
MKTIIAVCTITYIVLYVNAAPSGSGSASASGSISASSSGGGAFGLPFLTFENGNFGVNFGGYKASAGLGGLLTGNAAHGGLHASAETPFGQKAGAGLGGAVNGDGITGGGLYAGATAGNGVAAGAGLDGEVSGSGTKGSKRAFATTGISGSATKTITETRPVAVAPIYKEIEVRSSEVEPTVIYKTKTKLRSRVRSRPHHRKYYTYISEEPVQYVEKRVNVVQPVITKQKYVEKHYSAPIVETPAVVGGGSFSASASIAGSVGGSGGGYVEKHFAPSNEKEVVVERIVKPNREPEPISEEKEELPQQYQPTADIAGSASNAYSGSGTANNVAAGSGSKTISSSAAVSTSSGGHGHAGSLGYSSTFSSGGGGQLIRDIFNIPISTLDAVSKLVSNAVKNTSFSVSKSFSSSYAG